jgi:exodeoxyribonuclease VII large subunit
MQGDKTSSSIIAALDQIYQNELDFDAVVLIRGGGSKLDLAAFDQYELALNLAQFPLPILTGIGHERDESVADLVAHTAFKTPTAVANFLIDRMQQFELEMIRFGTQIAQNFKMVLSEYQELLQDSLSDLQFYTLRQTQLQHHDLEKILIQLRFLTQNKPQQAQNQLNKISQFFKISIPNRILNQSESLNRTHAKIRQQSSQLIHSHEKSMLQFEQLIKAYHPQHILNKGYAIVRQDGTILHSVKDFNSKSKLQIQVKDGIIDL